MPPSVSPIKVHLEIQFLASIRPAICLTAKDEQFDDQDFKAVQFEGLMKKKKKKKGRRRRTLAMGTDVNYISISKR